jgi:hypothetical protein
VHPIQQAWAMSDNAFFDSKIHTTRLARPLGVVGLGPISAFWPFMSEDLKPLTQHIGLAFRCKAALNVNAWLQQLSKLLLG